MKGRKEGRGSVKERRDGRGSVKGRREGMVSKTSGYECQKSRGRGG